MNEDKIMEMLRDINIKLAIIEEKLDNIPTNLDCTKKHNKLDKNILIIYIVLFVLLINSGLGIKFSHLLKMIGL